MFFSSAFARHRSMWRDRNHQGWPIFRRASTTIPQPPPALSLLFDARAASRASRSGPRRPCRPETKETGPPIRPRDSAASLARPKLRNPRPPARARGRSVEEKSLVLPCSISAFPSHAESFVRARVHQSRPRRPSLVLLRRFDPSVAGETQSEKADTETER